MENLGRLANICFERKKGEPHYRPGKLNSIDSMEGPRRRIFDLKFFSCLPPIQKERRNHLASSKFGESDQSGKIYSVPEFRLRTSLTES